MSGEHRVSPTHLDIRGATMAGGGACRSIKYKIGVNLRSAQLTSVVPPVNNYHARSTHSEQRTYRVRAQRTGANFWRNMGTPIARTPSDPMGVHRPQAGSQEDYKKQGHPITAQSKLGASTVSI